MSELIATTRQRILLNETTRLIGLALFTTVLAVAFLVLLVSDQVVAAGI